MTDRYLATLAAFRSSFLDIDEEAAEIVVESMNDWSLHGNVDDLENWFLAERRRLQEQIVVETIPLDDCRGWARDPATGNVVSQSGSFFVVEGVRTTTTAREVGSWDQPIITQIGYDGGILGLIRQRHAGIPHYLVEAKVEPGNVGLALVSPTLQATFANIERHHGGRAPHFVEWFRDPIPAEATLLRKTWLPEDGGRLMRKRNLGMVVELPAAHHLPIPTAFRWVSLHQMRHLIRHTTYVGPHIRGLVALL